MKFFETLTFSLIFINYALALDKVICYYESWTQWSYPPEDIDVSVCTHINYAFLGINEDGSLRLGQGEEDLLRRISALKQRNSNLKVLLSVGGWNEPPARFSLVAREAWRKLNMAGSSLWFLRTYGFDGLDIDWEYPGKRGGTPEDKENFIDMLWVIRNHYNNNGGNNYLLTVAVSGIPDPSSYNVNAVSRVVNFINVMTYDFHVAFEGKTGQNSPLYASSTDSEWEKNNANCDVAIKNWINDGAEAGKVILGLAFYGRTFRLRDPSQHGVGAPTDGNGISDGFITYKEICKLQGYTDVWDDEQKVPYKYSNDQWIGFDSPASIGIKVQYAKSKGLGGVMMWAVDHDDKDGVCGIKNPMLRAIKLNL